MPDPTYGVQPIAPLTIRFFVSLSRRPRCPACGAVLNSRVIAFHDGIAFCQPCSRIALSTGSWLLIALGCRHHSIDWTTDRGLAFWTPAADTDLDLVQHYLSRRRAVSPELLQAIAEHLDVESVDDLEVTVVEAPKTTRAKRVD